MKVDIPKIIVSNRTLDFGAGFYTTSDRIQAEKWAQTQTRRRRDGKAIVSLYEFDEKEKIISMFYHLILRIGNG